MGKYKIEYQCGHSATVQLFGPQKERDRKIDWMQQGDCPACWGEKQRAAEAEKPVTATVSLCFEQGGNLQIALTGGTMPLKEQIKKSGFRWVEQTAGIIGFLSTKKPRKAWVKIIPLAGDLVSDQEAINQAISGLQDICPDMEIDIQINLIDMATLQGIRELEAERAAEKKAKDAEKAAEKPVAPDIVKGKGNWNGKVYGLSGSQNIYLNGKQVKLTDEEAKELTVFTSDLKEWCRNAR